MGQTIEGLHGFYDSVTCDLLAIAVNPNSNPGTIETRQWAVDS